jgi:hypothetical protein
MLRVMKQQKSEGTIALMGATIHLLGEVHERISSTQIRAAAHKPVKALSRYVPHLVAEYIKKERLYTGGGKVRSREADHAPSGAIQEPQQIIGKAKLQCGVERSGRERDGVNGRKMLSFEEARPHGHAGRSHRNG